LRQSADTHTEQLVIVIKEYINIQSIGYTMRDRILLKVIKQTQQCVRSVFQANENVYSQRQYVQQTNTSTITDRHTAQSETIQHIKCCSFIHSFIFVY